MERVQLLWTGGWDSSFRLLQLALGQGRPVQPIYALDPERDSVQHELDAMHTIRRGALARLDDAGLIAPTQIWTRTDFPVPPHIAQTYRRVKDKAHVGAQYEWLASMAEALAWTDVELSMERYPEGPSDLQRLVFDGVDGPAEQWTLNDSPEAELFRRFSFPVRHLTKEDMFVEAQRDGYLDLLSSSWFCHTPVLGRPCGVCRPCQLAYTSSVSYASPVIARPTLLVRRARKLGVKGVVERARGLSARS